MISRLADRQRKMRERLALVGLRLVRRQSETVLQEVRPLARKPRLLTALDFAFACDIGIRLANNPELKRAFGEMKEIFKMIAEAEREVDHEQQS